MLWPTLLLDSIVGQLATLQSDTTLLFKVTSILKTNMASENLLNDLWYELDLWRPSHGPYSQTRLMTTLPRTLLANSTYGDPPTDLARKLELSRPSYPPMIIKTISGCNPTHMGIHSTSDVVLSPQLNLNNFKLLF